MRPGLSAAIESRTMLSICWPRKAAATRAAVPASLGKSMRLWSLRMVSWSRLSISMLEYAVLTDQPATMAMAMALPRERLRAAEFGT